MDACAKLLSHNQAAASGAYAAFRTTALSHAANLKSAAPAQTPALANLARKYNHTAFVQSREKSAQLNIAYDVLTNRKARLQYDGMFKKAGYSASGVVQSVDGLVGPMGERAVPISVRLFPLLVCCACSELGVCTALLWCA